MKKYLTLTLTLLLALLAFMLIGCDNGTPNPDQGGEETGGGEVLEKAYQVTLKADTGKHFSGITIEFLDENGRFLDYKETNTSGSVTSSKLKSNEVYIKLYDVPSGYQFEESYKLTSDKTEITLETKLLESTDLTDVTYRIGDIMHDFTLTDKNGTEYTLSGLLSEKKAVVLNFWYNTCHFCMQEFPDMDTVYNEYKGKIEILAINSVDRTFASETDSLSFPLIRDTIEIESAFANGYGAWSNPGTIIIDRYGVVSFLHIGALNEEQLTNLFEFYSAEDYAHSEYLTYADFNSRN